MQQLIQNFTGELDILQDRFDAFIRVLAREAPYLQLFDRVHGVSRQMNGSMNLLRQVSNGSLARDNCSNDAADNVFSWIVYALALRILRQLRWISRN